MTNDVVDKCNLKFVMTIIQYVTCVDVRIQKGPV